jgi:hypothetical protein
MGVLIFVVSNIDMDGSNLTAKSMCCMFRIEPKGIWVKHEATGSGLL